MAKGPKIENDVFVQNALTLMQQSGWPLSKIEKSGRSKLYRKENGETVRIRTCNDHLLIVLADTPDEGAKLNIEGTDWLLIVMPEVERTPGPTIAYHIPTHIVVTEARESHKRWLATNPQSDGNTTWNLWFNSKGPQAASGYATKWAEYRLKGTATTVGELGQSPSAGSAGGNLKAEVEAARQRIAQVAGVGVNAVRITIDF